MPIYLYRNQAGEEREIIAPMSKPPAEHLLIFSDGEYLEPTETLKDGRFEEIKNTPKDRRVFSRVYGAGLAISVPNFVCKPGSDGLPVSHASPRRKGGEPRKIGNHTVFEHADGLMTNSKGQPIIDSNAAAKRNAKNTGMELD